MFTLSQSTIVQSMFKELQKPYIYIVFKCTNNLIEVYYAQIKYKLNWLKITTLENIIQSEIQYFYNKLYSSVWKQL